MASYEYVCRECEVTLIESRSISDPEPVHICEKCGNRMNKVYTMSTPVFKGSGFYRTDK
jgi:putative FmdB family regulatory protein